MWIEVRGAAKPFWLDTDQCRLPNGELAFAYENLQKPAIPSWFAAPPAKRHSAERGGGVLVIEYVLSSDPWGIGGFLLSVLRQMIGGRRRFSEQMHLRRSYTAAEHGAGGDGDSEYCWPAGRENRETRRAERLAFPRSAL